MNTETKSKIWLSSPHMGTKEKEYVLEAFDTNWIAPIGPHIQGFESDIAHFLKSGSAAAVSSGTAATHLALILAGVGPGDEVLCQSFTFVATVNPVKYVGAQPVFVDSERETGNMDPVLLEKAILDRIQKGKKPKAIMPVHLYGMPAKIEEICRIADKYDIIVIEDAAESLGAHIHGKMTGTFGKMAILSFNGNKIITTSGGGAFLSQSEELVEKAKFLATQARDNAPHYQHSEMGFNYRLSNVSAGIGRGQMQVLPDRIHQRRENFNYYVRELGDLSGIEFMMEPEGYFSNRWLTIILVDPAQSGGITREDIRLALLDENIESRPLWKPMHLQPLYENHPFYSNGVSEHLFDIGLCLPSGSNLEREDLERVISKIKHLWKEAKVPA